MEYINKQISLIKEQSIKFISSVVVSLVMVLILNNLPEKKEADLLVNFKLKSDLLIIDYLDIFKTKDIGLENILNLEKSMLNQIVLSDRKIRSSFKTIKTG